MFRPTGFADLVGKRVGIFGVGVEGRAAQARLGTTADLVLVDDRDLGPDVLVTNDGGLDALATCDVVLKSPGIPRRRADVLALEEKVTVTSALNLWLHDVDRSRVVAITGTKGKSTTTSLVTFLLRALGQPALSLGNIGQPPYDPAVDTSHGWLILETSSYQCVDLDVAPGHVVVTSLGADHLDWHGSLEQYHEDKLSLTRAAGDHQTFVPDDVVFHAVAGQLGGRVTSVAPDDGGLARELGLLGHHSVSNVALALAVVASLTELPREDVRRAASEHAREFTPLRGRLTLVGTRHENGHTWRYVDDGLATAVLPTVAALEVFGDEPLALLAGGFDRGVDYEPLVAALQNRHSPTMVLTMGPAGERIARLLRERATTMVLDTVDTMDEAVRRAEEFLTSGGVTLLSPAAPSFDHYRNWEERSDDFTRAVRARRT